MLSRHWFQRNITLHRKEKEFIIFQFIKKICAVKWKISIEHSEKPS